MSRNPDSPIRPRPESVSGNLHLPALPTAPGHARRFVREQLRRWHLDDPAGTDLADTASIVTSELVTNAVAATGLTEIPGDAGASNLTPATVVLRLRIAHASLYIDIWDSSPCPPVPGNPDSCDENGRGLALVTALVRAWNWYPCDPPAPGKVVWAEIGLPTDLGRRLPPHNADETLPLRVPSGLRRPRPRAADPRIVSLVRSALNAADNAQAGPYQAVAARQPGPTPHCQTQM